MHGLYVHARARTRTSIYFYRHTLGGHICTRTEKDPCRCTSIPSMYIRTPKTISRFAILLYTDATAAKVVLHISFYGRITHFSYLVRGRIVRAVSFAFVFVGEIDLLLKWHRTIECTTSKMRERKTLMARILGLKSRWSAAKLKNNFTTVVGARFLFHFRF